MKILVTGGAGFVGSHACEHLLAQGHDVIALDNFDPYYAPERKKRHLVKALTSSKFELVEGDVGDEKLLNSLFSQHPFDVVLHLAACAGVRPSILDPQRYIKNNVSALITLLEAMNRYGLRRIVAASSSSVYGNVTSPPFREDAPCLQPLSPYGASKRAGEIVLGTYSALYGIKGIVVRPFTVYGPRQRPDMAIAHFARQILLGEPITLFGDGTTFRSYTFVADLVDGLYGAIQNSAIDFGIYNLGAETTTSLKELVAALEHALERKAVIQWMPDQAGDVTATTADISKARRDLNFAPRVELTEGLKRTVEWIKEELKFEGKLS